MTNRKLTAIFHAVFGAAWLATCPAQAQPVPLPQPAPVAPEGRRATPPVPPAVPPPFAPGGMRPFAPDARPGEPGVDDILGQLERLRHERAATDAKERALTELLRRKLAEQGERFRRLGLATAGPAGEADKPAVAEAPPRQPGPLYFPTRIGARRVYSAGGVEKVDVVIAVRAREGGAVTVTVADPSRPDSARHVRVSRTALALTPSPDGVGGRDVLRPAAAGGEQWLPWGEGGLVFRQAGFEQVTVPAGTFRALRVDTGWRSGPGFRAESSVWYAPGVGTVRQVNGGAEVLTLESFEPGD